jgi:hypothetical protein
MRTPRHSAVKGVYCTKIASAKFMNPLPNAMKSVNIEDSAVLMHTNTIPIRPNHRLYYRPQTKNVTAFSNYALKANNLNQTN